MELKIVIPMAGKGARFIEKGYKYPKPFIIFKQKMMIEHVLDSLPYENASVILIIQKEFEYSHNLILQHLKLKYNVEFSYVDKVTTGAACTALMAHKFINYNIPVLFVDSDNIFKTKSLQALIEDARIRALDGSLLTFPSKQTYFSYAEVDKEGYIIKTREKEVISPHAIAGAYYFTKGSDFINAAIQMIAYGDVTNSEYYMSNVYNYMIKDKKKIGNFEISQDDFHCVGTPQQLEYYLKGKSV